jgi:hypothetical protein
VSTLDDGAMIACADLVGRTGAKEFQIGFLNDEPPHQWYAHASYKGARIGVEDQPGPVEAADALCRRLLTGARCTGCGSLVALSDSGATAYGNPVMADGSRWTVQEAAAAGQCRWRRMGPKWVMGCESS